MRFIADLHIHSHFSRATSPSLDLPRLHASAQRKGVQIVGTGDLAHPGWLAEMMEQLEPAEEGLFRLKDEYAKSVETDVPPSCRGPVRFMIAGEISNIYKRDGKVRKVHNVVFLPDLETTERFQAKLDRIGNIRSDGRPILGLDSRDLLEIVLECHPDAFLIPAHIWTPWFSALGSKSGFDSIEKCFDDLTPHIFAVETGLSSDPPMNWRLSQLDRFVLVSNSDAHSPQKLAREANVFDTEPSLPAILDALRTGNPERFLGTIEFFPEEGKYHFDGHRNCQARFHPAETISQDGKCPVCDKPLTVGVMHRVEELADRPHGQTPSRTHPFRRLIPLNEVMSEILGKGPATKTVLRAVEQVLSQVGPELFVLGEAPLEAIRSGGSELLAEAIQRMREGRITASAGYDGEYGVIRVFDEQEIKELRTRQIAFFASSRALEITATENSSQTRRVREAPPQKLGAGTAARKDSPAADGAAQLPGWLAEQATLNPRQSEAVACTDRHLLIVAGPGTGKTRTLTYRIAHVICSLGADPASILALTFTNKAANEMRRRLADVLGREEAEGLIICTFHAFGLAFLRDHIGRLGRPSRFSLTGEADRISIGRILRPNWSAARIKSTIEDISIRKGQLKTCEMSGNLAMDDADNELLSFFRDYEQELRRLNLVDLDDLVALPAKILDENEDLRHECGQRYRWISVDEYQDINRPQYELLRLLIGQDSNLCAIGDPDQSIYGFRGSDVAYFQRFTEDMPGAVIVELNQSYRSTEHIVDAAARLIRATRFETQREMLTEIVGGRRVEIYQAPTEKAEAEFVVHQIERLVGGTSYFSLDSGRVDGEAPRSDITFGDVAVLFRMGALLPPLEEAFERSGIPFQCPRRQDPGAHPLVDAVRDYLAVLLNPNADLALSRILNVPSRGIGVVLQAKLHNLSRITRRPLWDLMTDAQVVRDLPVGQQRAIEKFIQLMLSLRESSSGHAVGDVISRIISETGIGETHSDDPLAKSIRRALLERAERFGTNIAKFLEHDALSRETDYFDPAAERVSLMTLHASKGLEFPIVFIIGCEQGILPYVRPGTETDREEERRLLYVGMTRAKSRLILTHAERRLLLGKKSKRTVSPYVSNVQEVLSEIERKEYKPQKKGGNTPDERQLSLL